MANTHSDRPHPPQRGCVSHDHKSQPRAADAGADEKPTGDGGISTATLAQAPDIARGPAGDCCILCGKVAENLPLDHGCKLNIDVQAYRAQLLSNSERWSR
jgi:hypothetical protein